VTADEALLDGGELRLVVLHIDVNVLQLANPFAVAIDQHLAVPFRGVPVRVFLVLGHRPVLLELASTGRNHCSSLSSHRRRGAPLARVFMNVIRVVSPEDVLAA
jgi:hypothetical protein